MEITLNNKIIQLQDASLQKLVNENLQNKTNGVAVAVNNTVVPKTEWINFQLKNKDDVLIIKASQGG